MFIRKIAIVLIPILFLTSCIQGMPFISVNNGSTMVGNGRMVQTSFLTDGSPITEIIIENVHSTINISPTSSNEVTYTIDENLQDLLDITHQDGTLRIAIQSNRPITSISSRNTIVFDIGTDALEAISASGSVTINGDGKLYAETFSLDIAGAGNANLELDAHSVSATIAGAANLTLSGTTSYLLISSAGASSINARNLVSQNTTVSMSGAGSAQVYAENTLDVSVAGVGTVTYWGDPTLTPSAAGLARVVRGN